MAAHVDEFGGAPDSLESGLYHRFGFAHESHHRTVGGVARVYVKQFDAFYFFYRVGDFLDFGKVASL